MFLKHRRQNKTKNYLTFNFNPEGLSYFVSNLISSSSSSLGEMHITADSSGSCCKAIALGNLGDGRGVGKGVGRGVGSGVGSSRIGERHLLIPLGTSRRIDGGWRRLLPDADDLCALSGSKTCSMEKVCFSSSSRLSGTESVRGLFVIFYVVC